MKLLGVSRRYQRVLIVCASVSLALGCATTGEKLAESGKYAKASTTTPSGMDGETGLMGEGVDAISKLYTSEKSGINIAYVDGAGYDHLVIDTLAPLGQYKVSNLENPTRLLLSFENSVELKGAEDAMKFVKTASEGLVKDIRIGSKGGTQLVVEFAEDSNVITDITKSQGGMLIELAQAGSKSMLTADELMDGVRAQYSAQEAEGEIIAEEATDKAPAQLAQENEKVMLTSFSLMQRNGQEQVFLKLSESPVFKLQKTAPSEFTVRLFETDTVAATPVLAKNSESMIRAVRAVKDGDDTLLRIFAKPSSDIRVMPKGIGELVIAANGMPAADEVMAQMDPETAAPEGEMTAEEKKKEELSEEDFARFLGDQPKYTGRLISLDLQETDIDNALRIIAEVSNLNIIASEDVNGKVTLRLIDVPWDQALDVILKTNGLDKVQEGNVVRIAPVDRLRAEREALKQAKQAEEDLEELKVKFLRVSYAKASELKPLVDGVLSERGLVSYDERTNQLIVKDIERGLKNVAQLVAKLDLRTPQVLLETQIVEANRSLLRDLGSEFGFSYVQSPQTGNATGSNFPNSVQFGGSTSNPAADISNSISLLLGSADGTKSLSQVVTALETEGSVRIVSRPAVATTNNTPAVIKSIEKIRIRLPQGGVSVATGQGASAAGQGQAATETIDIGIVLTVTPQASPDYFVLMDIDAKSSTLGTNSVDGIPSEVERSAQSTVLVSSGQTFALGGIYKTTDQTNVGGLPYLKDIPVFGHLFRRLNTDNRDEELLFFLTPRIVEGSFDDASMKATV